jgi:hypothetical protein
MNITEEVDILENRNIKELAISDSINSSTNESISMKRNYVDEETQNPEFSHDKKNKVDKDVHIYNIDYV